MSSHTKSELTGLRLLPKEFSPSINEVIIGRGRKVTNHSGNERFRDLIYSEIREYSAAENKTAKSAIIFRVLQQIKNGSPETGGFVKQDSKTKRWYAVEETTGRTTTAQAFRDALSSSYKSSKQFKQQRRWDRRSPSSASLAEKEEVPITVVSKEVAILPKLSTAVAPCSPSGFSSLSMPCTAAANAQSSSLRSGSNHLGDILNYALETVEDLTSFSPPMADFAMPAITCGESKCTKEMDFEQLVDLLGVPQMAPASTNPFEPTPISPTAFGAGMQHSHPMMQQPQQRPQVVLTPPPPQQNNGCFGHFWDCSSKYQEQDSAFWQESAANSAASGLSLKQALSSGSRQYPF